MQKFEEIVRINNSSSLSDENSNSSSSLQSNSSNISQITNMGRTLKKPSKNFDENDRDSDSDSDSDSNSDSNRNRNRNTNSNSNKNRNRNRNRNRNTNSKNKSDSDSDSNDNDIDNNNNSSGEDYTKLDDDELKLQILLAEQKAREKKSKNTASARSTKKSSKKSSSQKKPTKRKSSSAAASIPTPNNSPTPPPKKKTKSSAKKLSPEEAKLDNAAQQQESEFGVFIDQLDAEIEGMDEEETSNLKKKVEGLDFEARLVDLTATQNKIVWSKKEENEFLDAVVQISPKNLSHYDWYKVYALYMEEFNAPKGLTYIKMKRKWNTLSSASRTFTKPSLERDMIYDRAFFIKHNVSFKDYHKQSKAGKKLGLDDVGIPVAESPELRKSTKAKGSRKIYIESSDDASNGVDDDAGYQSDLNTKPKALKFKVGKKKISGGAGGSGGSVGVAELSCLLESILENMKEHGEKSHAAAIEFKKMNANQEKVMLDIDDGLVELNKNSKRMNNNLKGLFDYANWDKQLTEKILETSLGVRKDLRTIDETLHKDVRQVNKNLCALLHWVEKLTRIVETSNNKVDLSECGNDDHDNDDDKGEDQSGNGGGNGGGNDDGNAAGDDNDGNNGIEGVGDDGANTGQNNEKANNDDDDNGSNSNDDDAIEDDGDENAKAEK